MGYGGLCEGTVQEGHDLTSDAYYATAVAWAVENGITTGLDVTFFGVGTVCTRGQVVTFLYRTLA